MGPDLVSLYEIPFSYRISSGSAGVFLKGHNVRCYWCLNPFTIGQSKCMVCLNLVFGASSEIRVGCYDVLSDIICSLL